MLDAQDQASIDAANGPVGGAAGMGGATGGPAGPGAGPGSEAAGTTGGGDIGAGLSAGPVAGPADASGVSGGLDAAAQAAQSLGNVGSQLAAAPQAGPPSPQATGTSNYGNEGSFGPGPTNAFGTPFASPTEAHAILGSVFGAIAQSNPELGMKMDFGRIVGPAPQPGMSAPYSGLGATAPRTGMTFAPGGTPMINGVNMTAAQQAISHIESGSPIGNYQALGVVNPKTGDRAYGRYQVMGANVPDWSEKYYGQRLTPDEFALNPAAQDAVFNGQFGHYVQQYGPIGAAHAWLGGPGSVGQVGRRDYLGTSVGDYGKQFAQNYTQYSQSPLGTTDYNSQYAQPIPSPIGGVPPRSTPVAPAAGVPVGPQAAVTVDPTAAVYGANWQRLAPAPPRLGVAANGAIPGAPVASSAYPQALPNTTQMAMAQRLAPVVAAANKLGAVANADTGEPTVGGIVPAAYSPPGVGQPVAAKPAWGVGGIILGTEPTPFDAATLSPVPGSTVARVSGRSIAPVATTNRLTPSAQIIGKTQDRLSEESPETVTSIDHLPNVPGGTYISPGIGVGAGVSAAGVLSAGPVPGLSREQYDTNYADPQAEFNPQPQGEESVPEDFSTSATPSATIQRFVDAAPGGAEKQTEQSRKERAPPPPPPPGVAKRNDASDVARLSRILGVDVSFLDPNTVQYMLRAMKQGNKLMRQGQRRQGNRLQGPAGSTLAGVEI